MLSDILKNTDLQIYNELANGRLRPFLPENSKLCNIKHLVREVNTRRILKSVEKEKIDQLLNEMDLTIYGYRSLDDITLDIETKSDGKIADVTIKPKKAYSLKDYIDIPPAPDQKSAHFLSLISDEFERIKIRSNKILESIDSERKLSLYANKNIQKAKQIAHDARFLFSQLQDKGQFVNDNADVYILFVLNLFLIRTILFYRKFFKPFVGPCNESEEQMRLEFFHSIPVHRKYPYMFSHLPYLVESSSIVNESENPVYYRASTPLVNGDSTVPFSENKLSRINTNNSPFTKIHWNGQINVLVDVFISLASKYQVNGKPAITASREQIQSMILNNFTDKEGRDISEETIKTLLKPTRTDKRLKEQSPKKIDLSGFFTE
jgi:hypothetical protein